MDTDMDTDRYPSLKAVFAAVKDVEGVTFEGNMIRTIYHPNNRGTIADTIPKPLEKDTGPHRVKYKKPYDELPKQFGGGKAKPFDPDCLSLFVELDPKKLAETGQSPKTIARALTEYFKAALDVKSVKWDTNEINGDYGVEIKLPLTEKAFGIGRELALALKGPQA